MRLTVIMPLYNRENHVEVALHSLLRQRKECDLDVLVVNDGSTDSSLQRVQRLAEEFGHIRVVTTANQGVTRARNTGLQNVRDDTDLVSFLDSDDISPANRIRDDLQPFREDSELHFTYGRITLVDALDDERFVPAPNARQATVRGIQLGAGIYRAEFLRELGMFDESFEQGEDTDYLFRAFERNANYRLTDTICVYYRRHAGNMTLQRDVAMRSFIRAVHKSLARRRHDPSLGKPDGVFDMKELLQTSMD
mgnify:CR=1 FL=1